MARILLIDDEALLARSVAASLTRAGHHVLVAGDGRAGVEMYDRELPDLVITDLFMPEQEGMETIRLLRVRAPQLPIIAISGGGRTNNMDFLRIAKKLGATVTLAKPFAKDELIAAIATCMAREAPHLKPRIGCD